jgi:hypothetical protein
MDKTLKLYSTPRLAEAIGVSLVTIYRWVAAGKTSSSQLLLTIRKPTRLGTHSQLFFRFGFPLTTCSLKSGTSRSCSSILRRPRSSIGNPALCCDHV